MNDAKVKQYAARFASGELHESAMTVQLRRAYVRPLSFYGYLSIPQPGDDSMPKYVPWRMNKVSTLYFVLEDSAPLILNHLHSALGSEGPRICHFNITEQQLRNELPTSIHSQPFICASSPQLLNILTQFSNMGPTLYAANHPANAKRLFMATMLDEVSKINQLPLLPSDLLNIVADYVDIHLPYIPSEAKQQLQQWHAAGPHASASYPGQTANPVERPVDLDTFPTIPR